MDEVFQVAELLPHVTNLNLLWAEKLLSQRAEVFDTELKTRLEFALYSPVILRKIYI